MLTLFFCFKDNNNAIVRLFSSIVFIYEKNLLYLQIINE